jgi:uncharacterized membrane protein YraQ (UPF0718 family)
MQGAIKSKTVLSFLFTLIVSSIIGYILISVDILKLQDFSIVVVGIIIQAFPFLLIGTIISSLIGVFVSDELIVKFFPKKGIVATLSAIGIGIFLPLCDCAVIPVAARLRKKGVPVHAVVTFMMAAPIVNPVVILSTIYAFPGTKIALYRVVAGIIIAILTGAFLRIFYGNEKNDENEILRHNFGEIASACGCGSHEHEECGNQEKHEENKESCGCNSHSHEEHIGCGCHSYIDSSNRNTIANKIINAIVHAGEEFFQVSKLFIIGVFITSAIQNFIPRNFITDFAGGTFSAVFIMMIVAFVMSICSTSDSFIGRSFASTVPMSGIFGFVVFGPVLDLKNAIMMTGFFKKKFVVEFVAVAFVTAFVVISIASVILFK